MNRLGRGWKDFDFYILFTTVVLMGFSAVTIYSADGGGALTPSNLGVRQALYGSLGLVLMFFVVTDGGRHLHLAMLPLVSAATFGLFLSQLRGLAEHGSLSVVAQAGIVRSHSARLLERLVLYDLHFNYHSAHHRWPHCPSRHLPLVHERHLAGHVPLEPSMLATVVAIRAGDRS